MTEDFINQLVDTIYDTVIYSNEQDCRKRLFDKLKKKLQTIEVKYCKINELEKRNNDLETKLRQSGRPNNDSDAFKRFSLYKDYEKKIKVLKAINDADKDEIANLNKTILMLKERVLKLGIEEIKRPVIQDLKDYGSINELSGILGIGKQRLCTLIKLHDVEYINAYKRRLKASTRYYNAGKIYEIVEKDRKFEK